MTDERLDDALKDLRAELMVTPSPEFAAKVRERIERAPARPFWTVWTWAAVASTCGVAVVAGALWLRSDRGIVTPAAPTTDRPSATSLTQHMPTATPTTSTTPATRPGSGTLTRAATRPARVTAKATSEPEVLVPPDQLIAIRRLMAAVRNGAQPNMAPSPMLIDPDTGELIPLKPIEIPLITVDPLPGSPDGRSGGREK
jgi:hypothetical protein